MLGLAVGVRVMIFMGVMLEKWPNKGQEYLKYMFNVRLAASR